MYSIFEWFVFLFLFCLFNHTPVVSIVLYIGGVCDYIYIYISYFNLKLVIYHVIYICVFCEFYIYIYMICL